MAKGLIYTGGGFIPGVPAKDLTDEQVEKAGGYERLLSTGLYKKPKASRKKKEVDNGNDN